MEVVHAVLKRFVDVAAALSAALHFLFHLGKGRVFLLFIVCIVYIVFTRLTASSSAVPVQHRTDVTLIQVEDPFPPTTSASSTTPPVLRFDSHIVTLVGRE